jgi:hypothetical protein
MAGIHVLDQKDTAAKKSKSVAYSYFALPFGAETEFIAPLDSLIPQFRQEFQGIAKAFRKNLDGVTAVAWLPVRSAIANVSSRMHIAEALRVLRDENPDEPVDNESAFSLASLRVSQLLATPEGSKEMADRVIADLERSLQSDAFRISAAEILRQSIVLMWGSLEVLSSDTWALLLNLRPNLSLDLLQNERTKKWFQPKELISVLKEYGFDVSRNMGDVWLKWNRLDNLIAIREAFDAVLPHDEHLRSTLRQDSLWMLNQRRNLIVHRRGIVDKQYLTNTGDALEIGQELRIDPIYMEKA